MPPLEAKPALAVSLRDIHDAARLIRGDVLRTPMIAAPKLSELCGADVFVKYENLQATGSFKDRGALVKLLSLPPEARARGVITLSAGNHAQSVAFHARRLGIAATIVMPVGTPFVKVGNTEALGGHVILAGETLAEAREETERIGAERNLTMVHPYDDPLVIAGQGTVGLEILEDLPALDCVVVPVGGGGLIAGIATAIGELAPHVEIIGVEAAFYPSMHAALRGEEASCGGATLAEGIAVKTVGSLSLPIVKAWVSDIILVSEEDIERAICAYAVVQKTMAEGAGAAGLAAVLANHDRFAGRKVGLVLCGGNIDPRMLASIMVRGLEREGKITWLRIILPDRPGMLGRVTTCLGEAGANILEVNHRRMFLSVPAKGATLDVCIETKNRAHAGMVLARLEGLGYQVLLLSDPAGRDFSVM